MTVGFAFEVTRTQSPAIKPSPAETVNALLPVPIANDVELVAPVKVVAVAAAAVAELAAAVAELALAVAEVALAVADVAASLAFVVAVAAEAAAAVA